MALAAAMMFASGAAAQVQAKSESSMTTGVQPPPAPHVTPRPHRPHPYPLLPVRPRYTRCEQDRLLTDTSPCGPDTAEPMVIGETYDHKVMVVPKRP